MVNELLISKDNTFFSQMEIDMAIRLLKYARNLFTFIAITALLVTLLVSHNEYSEQAFNMCILIVSASTVLGCAMEMFISSRKKIDNSLTEVST